MAESRVLVVRDYNPGTGISAQLHRVGCNHAEGSEYLVQRCAISPRATHEDILRIASKIAGKQLDHEYGISYMDCTF